MGKLKTANKFIEDAKKIHGNKYDYSKVEYKGSKVKVCIICPTHGEFWQKPNSHLNGCGCPNCFNENRSNKISKNTSYFVQKAKQIHGDKYDYSKVEYKNAHTKVCIICPIHGEFWQKPNDHLNGCGCKQCSKIKQSEHKKNTLESFIRKAKQIHGDKYDYSKVEYIDVNTKVRIICPIHGEFWQKPNNHLNGHGCPNCLKTKKMTTESFIRKAKQIHGDKYDYSKVEYKNARTKVCIICPKHGEFWQIPCDHINSKCGCPSCSQSHLENGMYSFLKGNNIIFEQQKKFNWLGLMRLDFYLPEYNIAIECQGIQHYQPIEFFGGKKEYNNLIRRDKLKKQLCEEHNIKMIYVDNNTDFNDLKLR